MEVTAWTVFWAATVTAVATGLGALPFFFVEEVRGWWLGVANAFAGGLMLAASHSLIQEGWTLGPGRTLVGMVAGLVAILAANALIERRETPQIADLAAADARKMLLIVGVMAAHSFAEGVGVGVSYGDGDALGLFITSAIAIHNIPEGLAISLVLVPRGTAPWKAGAWSIFTSLPQPLMAVPAFFFVLVFRPFLPVGLGLAAGAMVWMVLAELVPDALEEADGPTVGASATLAFAAMLAFQHYVL